MTIDEYGHSVIKAKLKTMLSDTNCRNQFYNNITLYFFYNNTKQRI